MKFAPGDSELERHSTVLLVLVGWPAVLRLVLLVLLVVVVLLLAVVLVVVQA